MQLLLMCLIYAADICTGVRDYAADFSKLGYLI